MTRNGDTVTYHERSQLTYGTTTARLGTESQTRFGDCCLGLEPAKDPVVTPSGHIYSREAIVSYLLKKSQELKAERSKYERKLASSYTKEAEEEHHSDLKNKEEFLNKNQGGGQIVLRDQKHSVDIKERVSKDISIETKVEGLNTLKRTSYWLSDFQPEYEEDMTKTAPPPDRPQSPMSGAPLRLKNIISIDLKYEETKKGASSSASKRPICSVSGKTLTTQPVVLIKKTGQVMLKDMFEQLAKPSMTCPVTGKRFKDKDVLEFKKASSGFAASGKVLAKKYRPTLT